MGGLPNMAPRKPSTGASDRSARCFPLPTSTRAHAPWRVRPKLLAISLRPSRWQWGTAVLNGLEVTGSLRGNQASCTRSPHEPSMPFPSPARRALVSSACLSHPVNQVEPSHSTIEETEVRVPCQGHSASGGASSRLWNSLTCQTSQRQGVW